VVPFSIPSPPPEWKELRFPIGEWLHGILPFVPEDFALRVTMYAVFIIAGIVAAVLIANARLSKRGGEPWIMLDISLWAVIVGIIGARFYHVLTHPDDYFGPGKNVLNPFEPGSIWAIWEGGGAIFGSLIGGALGVYIGCRFAGLRFWSVADAIAPGLLVAQALGRLGNWFNQELFGLPTDLPWGLVIDRPNAAIPVGIGEDVLFHPTFLYELIWNLVGFGLIIVVTNAISFRRSETWPWSISPIWLSFQRRDFWQWGKVLGLYLVWYGLGRAWFESIRLDPSETFLGLRSNVWAALFAVVLGLVIIIVQSRRHPGVEPSVYLPGREWKPASAVDSEDTYSDTDDSVPEDGGDGAANESGPISTEAAATSR
jgi:prolipoprotein diacylglyceryl transferase